MISRKVANLLGEAFAYTFNKYYTRSAFGGGYYGINRVKLYDFLYINNYQAWFCNSARSIAGNDVRNLKDFIMKLHTGETQYEATKSWTWEQRQKLGQEYLYNLSKDLLAYYAKTQVDIIESLKNILKLEGYEWNGTRLIKSEEDIIDVKEEAGLLESLYDELKLSDKEIVLHHLKLSEEHYLSNKWDDTISNSRKYLESVLKEVAINLSVNYSNCKLSKDAYEHPNQIRNYLESEGLIEKKEKEAINSIYQLLSHTGGHPYMALSDQARLLRHLALTLAQFVLLRYQSYIKKHGT